MAKINFYVATDLDYYGGEARDEDVDSYIEFARSYLEGRYDEVEITTVQHYPNFGEAAEQRELREKVWDAFCRQ